MTETSATCTSNEPSAFRFGSVGRALPGIEVTLSRDNEVLVRGPSVAPGYYGDESATRELLDAENWLHTGDIGHLDADGFLHIVGRKKELIITSSGKNIAPATIEGFVTAPDIIEHAMIFGDGRPFVVALLTLNHDAAQAIANNPAADDIQSPADDERVMAIVQQAVDEANARVSRAEQVKRFALLNEQWGVATGELTPTLKLRRHIVTARHAAALDRLYQR
jgi:long-chain acyl-CoA synthetase